MKDIFSSVPVPNVGKSKFDLSHDVKLTGNMGYLIPVLCEDVLPGESWRWRGNLMLRVAPLIAPIMERLRATMHAFYVPERIMTSTWKEWISPQGNGIYSGPGRARVQLDTVMNAARALGEEEYDALFSYSSLWDYLGFPAIPYEAVDFTSTQQIVVAPFMAYCMIWQFYYKDQNVDTDDIMIDPEPGGLVNTTKFIQEYLILRKRAWAKDPFTSALPWPQRGAEVLMPLDGNATVTYKDTGLFVDNAGDPVAGAGAISADPTGDLIIAGTGFGNLENIESVVVTSSGVTINDFRTAVVVQQWLELSARGGARYNESILMHFNQKVPDYRLDQPEYIGGGVQFVDISEVLATATSEDAEANTLPQGNMAGHGLSIGNSNQFTYHVKEHGWIMVILSVMPDPSYAQGLPKKFTKLDLFDLGWPTFTGLGEQEMLRKEIYFRPQENDAYNDTLFGYQQQYYEYKSIPSRICGDFRGTLKQWTMFREFDTAPELDTSFIYADPTTRIFAVEDDSDKLWMHVYHEISALRPFPYFSVPGIKSI